MLPREAFDGVFLWHPTISITLCLGTKGTMELGHFHSILFIHFKTQQKGQLDDSVG